MSAAVKYDSRVPASQASRSLVASVRPQRVRDAPDYSSETSDPPDGDALQRQVINCYSVFSQSVLLPWLGSPVVGHLFALPERKPKPLFHCGA